MFNEDNVTHHNSLQVIHAERYLFSRADDFSLAEEMIEKNTDFVRGPRVTIS